MRRRRVALVALLVALAASSAAYVATGLATYARYQQVFGSYLLACEGALSWSPPNALFLGMYPNLATFTSVNVRSPIPSAAVVTVTIPGYTAPQSLETQSDSTFQALAFKPSLLPQAVAGQMAGACEAHAEIQAVMRLDGHAPCQITAPVTIYASQWIRWRDTTTGADLTPLIAGWVTPQAPTVETLVGKASDRLSAHPELYDATPALFGYDEGQATQTQVRDQVDALFDALQADYHLRYSADNPTFATGAAQIVQRPDDVLSSASPSGMCVETSVILASAVERLGMRPYLVFTASHAYLGVALSDGANARVTYWETSDLNSGAIGAQANVDGDAEYTTDVTTHAVKAVVDISYERSQGIVPIE